jgi:hypothetical protein
VRRLLWTGIISIWLMLGTHAQEITFQCPGGAPPSRLLVGEQAEVTAQGGSNFRDIPSAGGNLLGIIPTGERVDVVDGAYCAEGYAWWQVEYRGRRGWTAEGINTFYWLAPYIIPTAQLENVRIESDPALTSAVVPSVQQGFLVFTLADFPVEQRYQVPNIYITPAEAGLNPYRQTTRDLLAADRITTIDERPLAQVQTLDLVGGRGVRYLTLVFEPDADSPTPCCLLYTFRGITDDERYIAFNVTVTAEGYPRPFDETRSGDNLPDYIEDYTQDTIEGLDALAPDDFAPPLTLLDNTLRSLRVDAPLRDSAVLTYQYSDRLELAYHPSLAQGFRTDIQRTADNTQHLRLAPIGYPIADSATIRIYRTADIDDTWLARLQLLLSQQPVTPATMPVLTRPDASPQIGAVQYLRSDHGDGVRAVLAYDDGTYYSYQGISDGRTLYISALLPVTVGDDGAYTPPLSLLDALLQSLTITEDN